MNIDQRKQTATILTTVASLFLSVVITAFISGKIDPWTSSIVIILVIEFYFIAVRVLRTKDKKHDKSNN